MQQLAPAIALEDKAWNAARTELAQQRLCAFDAGAIGRQQFGARVQQTCGRSLQTQALQQPGQRVWPRDVLAPNIARLLNGLQGLKSCAGLLRLTALSASVAGPLSNRCWRSASTSLR